MQQKETKDEMQDKMIDKMKNNTYLLIIHCVLLTIIFSKSTALLVCSKRSHIHPK